MNTVTNAADAPLFQNEPFTNFADPLQADAMRLDLGHIEGSLPAFKSAGSYIESINPARPGQVLGQFSDNIDDVEDAVLGATRTFRDWKVTGLQERVALLRQTAALLRARKHSFSALLVLEAGKNWAEADADTAEAIDFLEFYALQAIALSQQAPAIQFPGERNSLRYFPLGVGVILPPWNFPLAILAGMTSAAIVTGNTVVLKPSPLSPCVAKSFIDLLTECGLPAGVVTLLHGNAETGAALVAHPGVNFIAFTGSKSAGLKIHQSASIPRAGQRSIKRTILELGGKDAILIDASANIEAAAQAVVSSAFGFSGQKCSACSRLVIHTDVYDEVLDAVVAMAGLLTWGDPFENAPIGPVIDINSYNRVCGYLSDAASYGRVLLGGKPYTAPADGYFIAPTIVADVDPLSRLSQEEIFGPVLAVSRARSFADGLDIVNNTEYGLTGALFSQDENNLAMASEQFHVGNLYLNRKCTGAMVGAHPFGGFNMSGTDSKAGGEDYLLQFTQAKSIARKLT
jgi:1-pyrroline-5-carboxylate dehydrogenase